MLLAALGRPADFTARVTFARSLFEAGGLEAVVCEAAEGRLSEAFRESGARVACLCSSDEVYARDAETAARALAEAEILYLAGRPGDEEEMFRAAGVGGFVFAGCDVLATLRTIHDKLGLRGGPAEVDR